MAVSFTPLEASRDNGLRRWNLIAGVLHLVSGVVLCALTDPDVTVPVFTNYANASRAGAVGTVVELQFRSRLGYLSGGFLLLAAVNHLLLATVLRWFYDQEQQQHRNTVRWIEYAVSASLMRVMVAQLCGVTDLHLLFALFGLTATTMLFGLVQERQCQSLLAFWLGCVPHLFAWGIIMAYFFHGVAAVDPPNWVWSIVFIEFVTDGTFAVNMFLQQWGVGPWRDYLFGEKGFVLLSFTAKSFLAWFNYGGTRAMK